MWPVVGPGGSGHQLFAYPVFVPTGKREAAASVLVNQGWDGRFGQTPAGGRSAMGLDVALRGALFAVLSGVVVVLLLLWRGG